MGLLLNSSCCKFMRLGWALSLIFLLQFAIVLLSPIVGYAVEDFSTDCLSYYGMENRIIVYCDSTISEIAAAIDRENILKVSDEEGTWLLNSSLSISKAATLTINNNSDIDWLKIISNPEDRDPHVIEVYGKLEINGAKISSWNPDTNYYATQSYDGNVLRPYIMIREKAGALNISNSEIAYLGYNGSQYNSSRTQGLNMYGGDGTMIKNSRIHDLWYGFYSDHVGYAVIENNTIYNNLAYGIDPHSGSHHMVVRNNYIINNTAGLVCSHLCHNILFENNQIHDNNHIGVLLSRNVSNSVIRYNNISDTPVGITIARSHNNQIYNNTLTDIRNGLQILYSSSFNTFMNNSITNSTNCAIRVSNNTEHNIIALNVIRPNQIAICH